MGPPRAEYRTIDIRTVIAGTNGHANQELRTIMPNLAKVQLDRHPLLALHDLLLCHAAKRAIDHSHRQSHHTAPSVTWDQSLTR